MGACNARRARGALIIAALALAGTAARAAEPPPEPLTHFPRAEVSVDSPTATHRFKVWLADTDPRRSQGLMYVKRLPSGHGMLFVFDLPQAAGFWMKNTLIPLDLLFIAADGRIIRIAANAAPMSLGTIESMGVVKGVLELAGGSCARLGISVGDRVRQAAFLSR